MMRNDKIKNLSKEKVKSEEIFFISDAHIGSNNSEAEKLKGKNLSQFFNYLTTLSPPPILYIVGDLFDFWFEYRYTIPAVYQKLLSKLVYLSEYGIRNGREYRRSTLFCP